MSALVKLIRTRGADSAKGLLDFVNRELIPALVEIQTRVQGRWGTAVQVTEGYQVQLTDEFVLVKNTAAMTVELPAAADYTKILWVKKQGNLGTVTVVPKVDSGETIDGSSSKSISSSNGGQAYYSDGTEWWQVRA